MKTALIILISPVLFVMALYLAFYCYFSTEKPKKGNALDEQLRAVQEKKDLARISVCMLSAEETILKMLVADKYRKQR